MDLQQAIEQCRSIKHCRPDQPFVQHALEAARFAPLGPTHSQVLSKCL